MAAAGPTVVLNSGHKMPLLGLGTWQMKSEELTNAVTAALDVGYRHIDTAWHYQNEREIGQVIRDKMAEGKLKREDVFLTTKLFVTFNRPEHVREGMQESLESLGLDYVDLFLIHSPLCMKAMESLVDEGLTKSIGVSNFNVQQLKRVLQECRIKPAVNQVELHPYLTQQNLVDFCKGSGVHLTAYSAFGSPARAQNYRLNDDDPVLLEDPTVAGIAKKHGKSAAQVLLRYDLDRGISVIPKSVTPSRIKANFEIMDLSLSEDDLATLNGLNRDLRYIGRNFFPTHKYYPF